jgi:hypothetical protein
MRATRTITSKTTVKTLYPTHFQIFLTAASRSSCRKSGRAMSSTGTGGLGASVWIPREFFAASATPHPLFLRIFSLGICFRFRVLNFDTCALVALACAWGYTENALFVRRRRREIDALIEFAKAQLRADCFKRNDCVWSLILPRHKAAVGAVIYHDAARRAFDQQIGG